MQTKAKEIAEGRRQPIDRIVSPLQRFMAKEASGGILLIIATLCALAWSNLGPAHSYERFFETPLSFGFGGQSVEKSLHHWINDGLMAIFFLVVGLEIKRELLIGELASLRKSALPVAGALGGMVAPAILYLLFNFGQETQRGWGILMATDIAFVIGVLALLGNRVPATLKVFLVALAIVDDIGAVLVIAVFYTSEIQVGALVAAGIITAILLLLNFLGVRTSLLYMLLGLGLWWAVLNSGIHATIAGVVLAFTVPATTRLVTADLARRGRYLLDRLEHADKQTPYAPISHEEQSIVSALESACEEAETPMQRMERTLHPWSVFFIMPVFALANAGVHLSADSFSFGSAVTLGVFFGLVVGKPVGISLLAWIAAKTGIAVLGSGVGLGQLIGAGCLGGIGFTMSIFIASLAFGTPAELETAKAAILLASLIAGILGSLVLVAAARKDSREDAEEQQ